MPIYRGIYDGPPAGYRNEVTPKIYLMWHCTANPRLASARDEIEYAKWRPDDVSSQYYADGIEVVQSLDTDLVAWHSGSHEGNHHAISWELVALPSWTRQQWLDNIAWEEIAAQARKDCDHHGITPRDLSLSQIAAGDKTGFMVHNEARLVWGGTDHTCPGPNFPIDHIIALILGEPGGRAGGANPGLVRPAPGPELPYPLPPGHYFGPSSWGARSVSGHYGRRFGGRTDRQWLRTWVEQLRRRGWPAGRGRRYLSRFGNDGRYGSEYAELIRAFQRDQGLTVDGLLGPVTWRAAYRNPVTP